MPAPVTRYTRVASLLHWIMAALMIFMLFFSEDLIKVPRGSSLADWGPSAHASFGILVLLLVIVRLLWRMGTKVVVWGDDAIIARRVQEHRDAGADHVCVQVLTDDPRNFPTEQWRALAPALVGG